MSLSQLKNNKPRFVTFKEQEGYQLSEMCVGKVYHTNMNQPKNGFTLGDIFTDILVTTNDDNTTEFMIVRGMVCDTNLSQFSGLQPFMIIDLTECGIVEGKISHYTKTDNVSKLEILSLVS